MRLGKNCTARGKLHEALPSSCKCNFFPKLHSHQYYISQNSYTINIGTVYPKGFRLPIFALVHTALTKKLFQSTFKTISNVSLHSESK